MVLNRFWLTLVVVLFVSAFTFSQEKKIAQALIEFEAKNYKVSSKLFTKLIKDFVFSHG